MHQHMCWLLRPSCSTGMTAYAVVIGCEGWHGKLATAERCRAHIAVLLLCRTSDKTWLSAWYVVAGNIAPEDCCVTTPLLGTNPVESSLQYGDVQKE